MIYATQQMDKEKLKQKGKVLRIKGVYASLSLPSEIKQGHPTRI